MDDENAPPLQRDFKIESSENGTPISDRDFENLFESGRIDSLLMLRQTMRQTRMAMSLADAQSPDHELVYVNEAFRRLTGYEDDEIIGRNCRFMQGPKTDLETVQAIRTCLSRGQTAVFELINYRKDGSTFWNALHIGPVYDAQGKLRYYFGSQWDISQVYRSRENERLAQLTERELNHRAMNTFSVISALITLSAAGAETPQEAMSVARDRVNALADAHRASLIPGTYDNDVFLQPLIERLLKPYAEQSGSNLNVTGADIAVPPNSLTLIGMAVHELATNSIKYGLFGGHATSASLDWQIAKHGDPQDGDLGRAIHMVWEETFDDGAPDPAKIEDGSGTRILRALLAPGNGMIERGADEKTFTVRLVIPLIDKTV